MISAVIAKMPIWREFTHELHRKTRHDGSGGEPLMPSISIGKRGKVRFNRWPVQHQLDFQTCAFTINLNGADLDRALMLALRIVEDCPTLSEAKATVDQNSGNSSGNDFWVIVRHVVNRIHSWRWPM